MLLSYKEMIMAKNMRQSYVTREQIEQAKQMDLLSYLQTYEPSELVQINPDVYTTRTHDSLKISKGKWCWWSQGIGGRSALDYLVKVRNMSFVDAVLHLCDCLRFEQPQKSHTPRPLKKPSFMLPKQGKSNDRVIDYLMQRGIGIALLRFCINTGRLYEDERHNCCFVGFDPQGIPRYAMLRSSNVGSTFLREVEGSDKRYSFSLPPQRQSNTLYLFESAIDCLSFAELQCMEKVGWTPENYLSLSGVYQPKKDLSETPLPIALMQFLQDNPHITCVALCLDNDEAGMAASLAISALLPERYTTELLLPEKGKDYNRQLQIEKGISPAIRMRGEPER